MNNLQRGTVLATNLSLYCGTLNLFIDILSKVNNVIAQVKVLRAGKRLLFTSVKTLKGASPGLSVSISAGEHYIALLSEEKNF